MSISVQRNQNLIKAGRAFVQQAKDAQKSRQESSRKNIEASVKDACGFFRSKALSRTYSIPGITPGEQGGARNLGFNMSQKQWDKIFKSKARSTRKGTASKKESLYVAK